MIEYIFQAAQKPLEQVFLGVKLIFTLANHFRFYNSSLICWLTRQVP